MRTHTHTHTHTHTIRIVFLFLLFLTSFTNEILAQCGVLESPYNLVTTRSTECLDDTDPLPAYDVGEHITFKVFLWICDYTPTQITALKLKVGFSFDR